jgi:hypothetical protein
LTTSSVVNAPTVNLRKLFLGLQEQMIGSLTTTREAISHPGTKGEATENHWLAMLNQYLPKRYQADKAFVVDHKGRRSQQIDAVIYDRQYSPFFFNQDGAKYVPAESVYAAFEIKQEIGGDEIEYAGKKIASVRELVRSSAAIRHAGGTFKPKKPSPILGGVLALDSAWADAFGGAFKTSIKKLRRPTRIDLGCILKCGSFRVEYGKTQRVHIASAETSLISFFLFTLGALQRMGTAPALDFEAYGKAIYAS